VAKIARLTALSRLREQRGLSAPKLSEITGIATPRLHSLEQDEAATKGELSLLADALGVPKYFLVWEDATVERVIPDFRFQNISQSDVGLSGLNEISRCSDLKSFLSFIAESFGDAPFARVQRQVPINHQDPTKFATDIANVLNFFPEYGQFENASEFFDFFRAAVEESGISVVVKQHRRETFRGFCLSDSATPVIFLNQSGQKPPVRIFTLAHEVAHAFLKSSGISDPFIRRWSIERFCNRVAANLLMPSDLFSVMLKQAYRPGATARDLVRSLARQIHLSQQATAVRIDSLGLLDAGFYGRWQSELTALGISPPSERTFDDAEIGDDSDEEEQRPFRNSSRSAITRMYGWRVLRTLQEGHSILGISKFDTSAFTGINPYKFDEAYQFSAAKKARVRR
jgi:Zn-dependent peptidase ImmA (M78 family)/transcriptional regulator with XRE-family HTH domain